MIQSRYKETMVGCWRLIGVNGAFLGGTRYGMFCVHADQVKCFKETVRGRPLCMSLEDCSMDGVVATLTQCW